MLLWYTVGSIPSWRCVVPAGVCVRCVGGGTFWVAVGPWMLVVGRFRRGGMVEVGGEEEVRLQAPRLERLQKGM